MSEKIVFFDIDGTLLGRNGKISLSTKKAIQDLRESGVYVAIATGRAPFMFKSIREELEIETFVSFNGQYVVFENKVIFQNPLDRSGLNELTNVSKGQNHSLVYMDEAKMRANQTSDHFIKESLESLQFSYPNIDPDFYKNGSIYQTLLFCEEKEDGFYRENFPQFKFVRWHEFSTDVLPSGGSKAKGIERIMEKVGIGSSNVYAVGDGLNDIEMLTSVGTGIAMGNAKSEVKQAADYVTDDVDDDGVLKGLKHVGLLK